MKISSGKVYPNGIPKSRLYEVFLSYRDFGCTPEEYSFDIEYTKLEELEGKDTCQWVTDLDGQLVVTGLKLARADARLLITPRGFRQSSKIMRVFISYAREDVDAAKRTYLALQDLGIDTWFDLESLYPGEQWEPAIAEAIESSSFVIALLSSKSVGKRGYVQKEIVYALDVLAKIPESEIYLIPARLDKCRPSHRALHKLHWIDLFPVWEEGWRKIERMLLERTGTA